MSTGTSIEPQTGTGIGPDTGTGSRGTRVLGVGAIAVSAAVVVMGLFITPPDVVQGDLVRLIYVHPAVSTWAFGAFGVTALSSVLYLFPRTRRRGWDLLAGSSAEIGVVLCALSLATGSIWGRAAWGVWWTWDARLTLTALLLALFLGYLALRRTAGPTEARARRSAVAGVLFSLVVPIDHFATEWWRTLHQGDTLYRGKPLIHGEQLLTMLASFLAVGLIGAWLLVHRFRVELLEGERETVGLERALVARRAEGVVAGASSEGARASGAGAPSEAASAGAASGARVPSQGTPTEGSAGDGSAGVDPVRAMAGSETER